MPDKSKSSPPDAGLCPTRRDYVQDGAVLIGCSRQERELVPEVIELRLANRHGLVTGATGTGKTVTLQVLAEGFSAAGVPVFAADIKGDLSGLGVKGRRKPNLVQRAQEIGLAPLRQCRLSGRLLGRAGRAGPSRARHRAGDGAAAAVAPARADRAAGRRAQHRLQVGRGRAQGRRRQHGDRRPPGPARRHRRDGQARRPRCAASTATSRRRPWA